MDDECTCPACCRAANPADAVAAAALYQRVATWMGAAPPSPTPPSPTPPSPRMSETANDLMTAIRARHEAEADWGIVRDRRAGFADRAALLAEVERLTRENAELHGYNLTLTGVAMQANVDRIQAVNEAEAERLRAVVPPPPEPTSCPHMATGMCSTCWEDYVPSRIGVPVPPPPDTAAAPTEREVALRKRVFDGRYGEDEPMLYGRMGAAQALIRLLDERLHDQLRTPAPATEATR
jgi:hypothetical protein